MMWTRWILAAVGACAALVGAWFLLNWAIALGMDYAYGIVYG